MEELLVELVQAPTELGHEEAGQALMADAMRGVRLRAPRHLARRRRAARAPERRAVLLGRDRQAQRGRDLGGARARAGAR